MSKWVAVYHDGDAIRVRVVHDPSDSQLPFGAQTNLRQRQLLDGEGMLNALVEVPDDWDGRVVIDDEDVVDLTPVGIA